MEVLPEPGAPYCGERVRREIGGCQVVADTYKEITTTEGNAALCIPLFALHEVAGIVEEKVLDSWIKDDRPQRTFWTRRDMSPVAAPALSHVSNCLIRHAEPI